MKVFSGNGGLGWSPHSVQTHFFGPCRNTPYGEQRLSRPKGGLWRMEGKALQAQRGLRFVPALRGNAAEVSSLRFPPTCWRSVDNGALQRVGDSRSRPLTYCHEVKGLVSESRCSVFGCKFYFVDGCPVEVLSADSIFPSFSFLAR